MPVRTQYDNDRLCRIEARGDATLAEIHFALRRHLAGNNSESRILLDLRSAVLRANARDVRIFQRYLNDELMPHLENYRSAGLAEAHAGLRVAEDVEDVEVLLNLP